MQLADMYFPAVEAAGPSLAPSSLAWPELVSKKKQHQGGGTASFASKPARAPGGKAATSKKAAGGVGAQKRLTKVQVLNPFKGIADEEKERCV